MSRQSDFVANNYASNTGSNNVNQANNFPIPASNPQSQFPVSMDASQLQHLPHHHIHNNSNANATLNRQSTPSPLTGISHQQHKLLNLNETANYQTKSISPSASQSFSGDNFPFQMQPNQNQSDQNLVKRIIDLTRELNIKLVAFDFDCTLCSIHTGGNWIDSPEKLAEFVRPCFRELLPSLLKCCDVNTCVVTYSPQERLIREVLRISMKDEYENEVNNMMNKIIIKGNTKAFVDKYGFENCYTNGKEVHLEFCRNQFENIYYQMNGNNANSNVYEISNQSMLLIDDDETNLRIALENNHLAFQVTNGTKLIDLYRYLWETLHKYK